MTSVLVGYVHSVVTAIYVPLSFHSVDLFSTPMSSTALDFLSIPDNRNDASNDSINPYAYPYFHSDGTSPLLYDLIVQFGGKWVALDPENHDNVGNLAQLVRQIELRSETVSKEASWKDSCGDTSLHRFCQVARLPASPLMWPKTKWLVNVARALIRADPNLTTAVNNWQETPLLQFVTHCGFPLEPHRSEWNANSDGDDDHVFMDAGVNPMVELLELLLWGGAASVESYPNMNLPIHCALNAGLEPRRISRQQRDGRSNQLASGDDSYEQETLMRDWLEKLHFAMVKRLLRSFPAGIGFCDFKRRPPLLNAIVSNSCVEITELLLHSGGWQQHCTTILLDELFAQYSRDGVSDRFQERLMLDKQPLISHDDEHLEKLWRKTESVLRVITEDQRMVHAAIKANAPLVVLQVAVRLYPMQLSGHRQNRFDPTPLMRALTLRSPPTCRFQYLQILLQASARLAEIPNVTGQLPLHVACSQSDLMDWENGLSVLFQSHPTAVAKRDPVSKLFPFQIAATATEDDSASLDCTYELLRADPSVLLLFS